MISVQKNVSLKAYNTFGIDVFADELIRFTRFDDIKELKPAFSSGNYIILGGGSNILFTGNVKASVVMPDSSEIEIIEEKKDWVKIKVSAGMNWDGFVAFCVENDFGGVENLSYIPGKAGAAPIQNIGAYGAEIKDVLESVTFYDISENNIKTLPGDACRFSYRDSVFKQTLKGKILILSLQLRLTKINHRFKLDYGPVKEQLKNEGGVNLSSIRKVIVNIRKSKLPEPEVLGNAGSFFKNPVISKDHFNQLRIKYNNIPSFPADGGLIKVPAAWLIEKRGWKGRVTGNAGVHKNQPLVLVNYTGLAKGNEILGLAREIIHDVKQAFNIELQKEVNVI